MANINVKNAAGTSQYMKSSGAGSDVDPFIVEHYDATVTGRIGEVQASPTANTLLDRLKALLTGIVLAAGTNNIGDVDVASIAAGTNNIGDVDVASIAAGTNNIGDVDVASIAAGENQIGTVGSPDSVISVTATLDTLIYADGDVLFDTQEIASAARVSGGTMILQSVTVLDEDDQGAGFDLIFLNASNSLGTENAAPNISDANAAAIIGRVQVGSGAFYDLGGCRIACVSGIGLLMQANASTSIYVAGISRGTGTYTAAGLKIKFAFMRN